MTRLRVYGWRMHENGGGYRYVMAATSKKALRDRFPSLGPAFQRDFVAETGNEREIAIATARPGVPFRAPDRFGHREDYEPIEEQSTGEGK